MGLLSEQSAVRALHLGNVRFTYVVDGAMWLDPARFFPQIPRTYWAGHPEALDPQGRVAMSAGGLLVERDGRALMIDVGLGVYTGPLAIDEPFGSADSGALPETLAALGRSPADIEAVAFTHLHADHTGWAFADGRKYFPDARYLVAEQEWEPHRHGGTIPGAPPRELVIDPLAGVLTLITEGEEVFPGVHAIVTPGHSPGHTSFVVSAGTERVIAFGDAFHVPAQLTHPEWPSRPDVDHAAVLSARKRIVAELKQPGAIGFSCHFGDQAFGRLTRDDVWEPVEAEALLPPPRG